MAVLHYRKDRRLREKGNWFVKCRKDGSFQTWQLTAIGACCLVDNGFMGSSEFDYRILRVLIECGHAYLFDPDGAKAKWHKKVEDSFVEDPAAANEKYGRVLRWLKARKSEGSTADDHTTDEEVLEVR